MNDISDPVAVLWSMTAIDWAYVTLATGLIFFFLGRRLIRDIQGWLA